MITFQPRFPASLYTLNGYEGKKILASCTSHCFWRRGDVHCTQHGVPGMDGRGRALSYHTIKGGSRECIIYRWEILYIRGLEDFICVPCVNKKQQLRKITNAILFLFAVAIYFNSLQRDVSIPNQIQAVLVIIGYF